jgi:hypothetical protein
MEEFTECKSVLNLLGFWRTSLSALIDYNTEYMEVDFLKTFSKNQQNHYAATQRMRQLNLSAEWSFVKLSRDLMALNMEGRLITGLLTDHDAMGQHLYTPWKCYMQEIWTRRYTPATYFDSIGGILLSHTLSVSEVGIIWALALRKGIS